MTIYRSLGKTARRAKTSPIPQDATRTEPSEDDRTDESQGAPSSSSTQRTRTSPSGM
jgi:hypothetical protein